MHGHRVAEVGATTTHDQRYVALREAFAGRHAGERVPFEERGPNP